MRLSVAVLVAGAAGALGQSTAYEQCGGTGWSGATTCVSGYTCTYSNDWYSQCLPGAVVSGGTTTPATTLVMSSIPSATVSGGSVASDGPGTTLQSGYYWIRAVESPNFHQYLQTNPEYQPGIAILDSYTTAGQFQIVSGQLVELTTAGLLYANVEDPANITTAGKLSLTFDTTKNTFGTFMFSGDAVQWTTPTFTRPNPSAWLVCGNQSLWINLGNYDYLTPAGCVDETIHYYNGATAVDKRDARKERLV